MMMRNHNFDLSKIDTVLGLIRETRIRLNDVTPGGKSSGTFASAANDFLQTGNNLLLILAKNNKISDEEKLKQYEKIIVGTISFAMAIESGKYAQFHTPVTYTVLVDEADKGYIASEPAPIPYADYMSKSAAEEAKRSRRILTIGEKVLVDKTIPLFGSADLFFKHKISIDTLQSLKTMIESNIAAKNLPIENQKLSTARILS